MPSGDAADTTKTERSAVIQLLLPAITVTLVPVSTGQAVDAGSVELTAAAVTLGAIAGTAASLLLTRYQFDTSTGDGYVLLIVMTSIVVVTGALWLLLPEALFERIPHFGATFVWGFAVVSVARDLIWPKAMEAVPRSEAD